MRLENDLKPHNKETYGKLKDILQTNNKTCIIQPTGSGKMYLILKLIEDYVEQDRDIIVIEPQKYIFEQLQKKMDKYGLRKDNVKFLTYSSLGRMNDEKIQEYNSPKLVLVDEMHRVGAPKWNIGLQKMFDVFPDDCKYVGFSATPIRFLDGKRNMTEELFNGCIANEINLADAILNRILPLPRYIAGLYTYDNEVNAITRKIEDSRNTDEEKEEMLKEVAVMKKNLDKSKGISSIFKKYINQDKGKYVAFCKNINHLKLMRSCLKQWFLEAGISCDFYEVHCKNPEKDKQFNAFMADDKLSVCLSVAMLSEGVHGIDGVILLRCTTSPNLYYQQIGRVFSVDMDTVPIIFDLVANCQSIMECNLKNDLLDAIDKRDKNKVNEETCVDGEQNSEGKCNSDDCNTKEITRDDIEFFFVFDQVIDAVNAFKEIEDRILGDDWTKEDDDILISNYKTLGIENIVEYDLFPGRSKASIINRARRLGITKSKNKGIRLSENDKRTIEAQYKQMRLCDLEKLLPHLTKSTIWRYVKKLPDYQKVNKHIIPEKKKEFIKKYYNEYTNKELEKLLGLSAKTICAYANSNGIKKEKNNDKYVYYDKSKNNYFVAIRINGKMVHFGRFANKMEAKKVAQEKAKEYGKII